MRGRLQSVKVWSRGQGLLLPFWLIFVLQLLWTALFFARPQVPPAAYIYSQTEYRPAQAALCPGDMLVWRPTIYIEAAPDNAIAASIIWSVWGEAQHEMVVRNIPVQQSAFIASVQVSPSESYRIPGLPPGAYALHEVRRDAGRQANGYRVPFEVLPPEQCPKGRS